MDQIRKMLRRVSPKDRQRIKAVIGKLRIGDETGLDIAPLRGYRDAFRVRVGGYRLILRREGRTYRPVALLRRNEKTYN